MPFYDYVNMNDPDDVLVDAWFGKFEEKPDEIHVGKDIYIPKQSFCTWFKLKGSGWTDNKEYLYPKKHVIQKYQQKCDDKKRHDEKVAIWRDKGLLTKDE